MITSRRLDELPPLDRPAAMEERLQALENASASAGSTALHTTKELADRFAVTEETMRGILRRHGGKVLFIGKRHVIRDHEWRKVLEKLESQS